MKKYEIKEENKNANVKVVEIESKEFYVIEADYFENEIVAETNGYYWDDEMDKWTKEIIDNTTTVF